MRKTLCAFLLLFIVISQALADNNITNLKKQLEIPKLSKLEHYGSIEQTISKPPRYSPQLNPTTHKPIFIMGNKDFTAENGVIAGSGTRDDPYIIANWVIMANGTAPYGMGTVGIFIANTTKCFVIRNVTIFGGDWGYSLKMPATS